MAYRDYSTAVGRIVDPNGAGDFTTIGAALAAASAGQTIFVRPGTYTENINLVNGVNLAAWNSDSISGNVVILGKVTASYSGTASITGISLKTNSDFCLVVSGSNATVLWLYDCFINCNNNTGISFTSSNASSTINIIDCSLSLFTTGIAYFTSSSPGTLAFYQCILNNNPPSSTASTTSSGLVQFFSCVIASALTTSSTGIIQLFNCFVHNDAANLTALTTAGTGISVISGCTIFSGTAAALSVGSGTTLTLSNTTINANIATVITGAGTLNYTGVAFTGGGSSVGTTVRSINPFSNDKFMLLSSVTASNTGSISFTSTIGSLYTQYLVVISNVLPVTNTANLEMTVSNNNGSTYAGSGYNIGSNYTPYNSTTTTNKNNAAYASLSGPVSNVSANGTYNAYIYLFSMNDANFGQMSGQFSYFDTTAAATVFGNCGGILAITGINAIKFLFNSGNISTGTFTLYGIRET